MEFQTRQIGILSTEEHLLYEKGLYPVGGYMQDTLAINLSDPKDRRVYYFDIEDSWESDFEGARSASVAFGSLAEMWGRVATVQVGGDGEVIAAKR